MSEVEADTPEAVCMSEALVQAQCKRHDGYTTPELNQKLYLHHFGFTRIAHLDGYTGCTVLYLNDNLLTDLTPLQNLRRLRSLYLANNRVASCQTLPHLPELETLDLGHNLLEDMAGIAQRLPALETLLLPHNRLTSLHCADGVDRLVHLTSLDVSFNRLADAEDVLDAVRPLAGTLRTGLLHGNPFLQHTSAYRRRCVVALPGLRHLDDRPVTPGERERAGASLRGGAAAERDVVAQQQARQDDERTARFAYHGALKSSARARRREKTSGAPPRDDDGDLFVPNSDETFWGS